MYHTQYDFKRYNEKLEDVSRISPRSHLRCHMVLGFVSESSKVSKLQTTIVDLSYARHTLHPSNGVSNWMWN